MLKAAHKIARYILASVLLLCTGSSVIGSAQDTTQVTVLRAAHLFDGMNENLSNDAVLIIRNERIIGVGKGALIPDGAHIIDLGNATLLPGFIDAHSHLTLEPDANYYRKTLNELLRNPTEMAFYAATNARRTLEAGFTTVRHVGGREFIDVGLRNAIAADLTVGPRILAAGNAITATGGSCDRAPFPAYRVTPLTPLEGVCTGADQCREAVRNQIKWGADVIKICASGGVLSYDPVDVPQLSRTELDAAIAEAHQWGRKVAAHAHGDTAARLAVEAGIDSIEHGSFLSEDTLKLMKAKGVFLVPTFMALDWVQNNADSYPANIAEKARVAAASHSDMFRLALRIGVPIALGTDATVRPDGHGRNAMEFALMVDAGMRPGAALLAGTSNAARLLGLDTDIGTLTQGKFADIVAVSGNPLIDIHATERPLFVMQRGHVVRQDGISLLR
jgi:imidazolonepropionase-like amidohydrolase